MFAMVIEEVFEIKGRGVVLSGRFDSERYSICENTCLYDMYGNEYVVSGIAMIRLSAEAYSDPKNYRIDLLFKGLIAHDNDFLVGKLLTTQFDFQMLYPADPLDSQFVDVTYREEAVNAGNYALINFELLLKNEFDVKGIDQNGKIVRMMYRGLMISPETYELLYNKLAESGVYLINTPQQYRHCYCLPEWYDDLADITIRSAWTDALSDKAIEQLLVQFGNDSLIVKDYVKSRKHEWYDA